MAQPDIKLTAGIDGGSIRKTVESALRNINITLSPASLNQISAAVRNAAQASGAAGTRIQGNSGMQGQSQGPMFGPRDRYGGFPWDASAVDKYASSIVNTNNAINSYTRATGQAAKATTSFAQKVGFTTTRFSAYFIAASSFWGLLAQIGDARQSIININKEINRLTQILDGNRQAASNTTAEVLKIAEAYGQSGAELLKVTTILSQAGGQFRNPQNLQASIESLAKTQLAATFGNLEQVTTGSIAVLNQFRLDVSRLNDVLDIANQLSKDFAFESENLFVAVERGGSSFSVAGGTIEEFAATVAALRDLTRLPSETIGTGLNTISQYYLRPENIQTLERLAGSDAIRNADGSLKGIIESWIALADVTKDYSDEQLQPIIEQFAKIRQSKVFVPLLRDIQIGLKALRDADTPEERREALGSSKFLSALDTSRNSIGSLSRDAVFGLQTIDAQLKSIGARFEQVFKNFAEDEGIKNLVSQFAFLSKQLADILDKVRPLIPLLIQFGTIKLASSIVRSIPDFVRGAYGVEAGSSSSTTRIADQLKGFFRSEPSRTRIYNDRYSMLVNRARRNTVQRQRYSEGFDLFGERRQGLQSQQLDTLASIESLQRQQRLARIKNPTHLFRIRREDFVREQEKILNTESRRSISNRARELLRSAGHDVTFDSKRGLYRDPKGRFVSPERLQQRRVTGVIDPRYIKQVLSPERLEELSSQSRSRRLDVNRGLQLFASPKELAKAARLQAIDEGSGQISPTRQFSANLKADQKYHQAQRNEITRQIKILRSLGFSNEQVKVETDKLKKELSGFAQKANRAGNAQAQYSQLLRSNATERLELYNQVIDLNRHNTLSHRFGQRLRSDFGRLRDVGSKVISTGLTGLRRGVPAIGLVGATAGTAFIGQQLQEGIRPLLDSNGKLADNIESLASANKDRSILAGILQGAGTGAFLGASFGLPGAIIGGLGGAVIGGFAGAKSAQSNIDSQLFGSRLIGYQNQPNINNVRGLLQADSFESGWFTGSNQRLEQMLSSPEGESTRNTIRKLGQDIIRRQVEEGSFRFDRPNMDFGALGQEIGKSLGIDKLNNEDAAKLSRLINVAIYDYADDLRSLAKETKDLIASKAKLRLQMDMASSNLYLFINNLEKSTKALATSNAFRNIWLQNNSSVFNSLLGQNNSPLLMDENYGSLLLDQFLQNSSFSRGPMGRVSTIQGQFGGLLNYEESRNLSDLGLIRDSISGINEELSRQLTGFTFDDPAQIDRAKTTSVNLIENVLSGISDSVSTQEARTKIDQLKAQLIAVAHEDPSKFADPSNKIADQLVGKFIESFRSALQGRIQEINLDLQQDFQKISFINNLNERSQGIRERTFGLNINNIQSLRTFGLTDNQSLSRINNLISDNQNTDELDKFFSSLKIAESNVVILNKRLQDGENVQKELGSAQIELVRAQSQYNIALQQSALHVSALRFKFEELTNITSKLIDNNKQLALTPLEKRFEAEANASILTSVVGDLFQTGPFKGVQNERQLLDVLAKNPEAAQLLNNRLGGLAGQDFFIEAIRSAETLGLRRVPGTGGMTFEDLAGMTSFGAGLSVADPTGENQNYLIDLEKQRLDSFSKSLGIEEQQLVHLQRIDEAIRQAFNLPLFNNGQQAQIQPGPTSQPSESKEPKTPRSTDIPNAQRSKQNDSSINNDEVSEINSRIAAMRTDLNEFRNDPNAIASNLKEYNRELVVQMAETIKNALINSGGKASNVDITGTLNVMGFENAGKDVAAKAIIITILKNFVSTLSASDPAEAGLKQKFLDTIREFESQ